MGRGPAWTQEEGENLRMLRDFGLTAKEISAAIGRSPESIASKAHDLVLPKLRKYSNVREKTIPQHIRDLVLSYYGKKTASELSEITGISRNSVCSLWRRMKIDGLIRVDR